MKTTCLRRSYASSSLVIFHPRIPVTTDSLIARERMNALLIGTMKTMFKVEMRRQMTTSRTQKKICNAMKARQPMPASKRVKKCPSLLKVSWLWTA